jgi:hypothetical protein
MSEATWLLFLETKFLDEFFLGIYIPFDCEFLVAQRTGKNAVVLTEVYQVKATHPLQTYPFGTWTSHGGLSWPNISFYQRRDNLQGLVLRTAFLKVCMSVRSCTKQSYVPYYSSVIYLSFVNILGQ